MSNENVTIEKSFSVQVTELYQAWTQEDALKTWWKPAGRKLTSVEADLTEEGTLKYIFENNEHSEGELLIEGKYKTVKPERELVYTWNWSLNGAPVENGAYKLHVQFSKDGEGSKLSVIQESENDSEGIHPHHEGWEKALNDLGSYLSAK